MWLPPLLGGIVLGVVLFGAAECVRNFQVGNVDQPPPATPVDYDLTLILTNRFLENQITQSISRSTVPGVRDLSNVRVETGKDLVRVTARARVVFGVGPTVEAQFRPYVDAETHKIKLEVVSTKNVPTPGTLENLIEPFINDRVERATSGYPADIKTVHAPAEGVTVQASLRPGALAATATPGAGGGQTCTCITATPTPGGP